MTSMYSPFIIPNLLKYLYQTSATDQAYPDHVLDHSIIAHIMTSDGDISGYDRATDSLEAIADAVSVLDGFHDVPSPDATTNTYMRDVVGNKSDAAQTTVGTTRSIIAYVKGCLNQLATVIGYHTVPTADVETNSQLRDVVGNKTDAAVTTVGTTKSLMAYLKGVVTAVITTIPGLHAVPTADATTNTNMRDVTGNKTDAAVTTVGTEKSLMGYLKGALSVLVHSTYGNSAIQSLIGTANLTTTDSLHGKIGTDTEMADESLYDMFKYYLHVTDGTASTLDPTHVADGSIIAKIVSKGANGTTPETFNCTTDSLEAISDAVGVVDGYHDVPTADVTTNTVMRDVVGNKTDAAVTTVGTEKSIMAYIKGALNQLADIKSYIGTFTRALKTQWGTRWDSTGDLGTDVGTIITSTGTTIPNLHAVPAKDAATDTNMRDVVGKKDDTAVVAVATDKSILGYVKGAISLLVHGTYGLSALQTLIAAIPTTAMRGTDDAFLASVGGALDTAATYAVAADKTVMAYVKGLVASGIAAYGTVSDVAPTDTDFDTSLSEATDDHYNYLAMIFLTGNLAGQVKDILDYDGTTKNCSFYSTSKWTEAPANGDAFAILPFGSGQINAVSITSYIESLIGALDTAAATGAVSDSKTAMAYIKQLVTSENKVLCSMDFWSAPVEEVSVDGDASTLAAIATTVVAEVPGTFVRVIGMFKFRAVENTYAGVNKLDGATVAATSQVIQIDDSATTGYVDCITFVDDMFTLAASTREGGDVIIGSTDVAARVDGNDTYTWRWLLSKADQDDINFNDVQFGLRVWYSI